MAQYIDKSAVVAEIENKKKYAQTLGDNAINGSMQQFYDGMKQGCVDILSFLNTLKVKEIDNIWHDVSEELPVMHRRVLLYTEEGTVMQGRYDGGAWVLDIWVPKFPKILKWCYLSDVLPSETTKD